ncbi:MAG: glutamate synthase large subunit, partial [Rhodococcus sp.]|nr:glutamate synthase large subunit [Rhodococcus sp. (in: high G+C Gram-positive bacteria)]
MTTRAANTGLYDPTLEKSNCGVGFITRKDGTQTHDILAKAHAALCEVPHRGGMNAEGVGDGAGVSVDLSVRFFRKLTGNAELEAGRFGVGNFFLPNDTDAHADAEEVISRGLATHGLDVLQVRDVPVDNSAIRPAGIALQLPIRQWIFAAPDACTDPLEFDKRIHEALLDIEAVAYTDPRLTGLYP